MKTLARIVSILCATVFVVAAPAAVLAFNVAAQGLSGNVVKSALDRPGTYESFVASVSRAARGRGGAMANLSEEEVRTYVTTLLPIELIRPVAYDGIDQLFAYIRGERDGVAVSMAGFKAGAAERTRRALYSLVVNKPDCTPGVDAAPFSCRPTGEFGESFSAMADAAGASSVAGIPDVWSDAGVQQMAQPADQRRMIVSGLLYSPIVPAALLILITLLSVRSLGGFLRWWGVPLLIGGAIGLGAWAWLREQAIGALAQIRLEADLANPGALFGLNLLDASVQDMLTSTLTQMGALAGAGLLLCLGAVFVKPRADAEPA